MSCPAVLRKDAADPEEDTGRASADREQREGVTEEAFGQEGTVH